MRPSCKITISCKRGMFPFPVRSSLPPESQSPFARSDEKPTTPSFSSARRPHSRCRRWRPLSSRDASGMPARACRQLLTRYNGRSHCALKIASWPKA